jgi:hypothetical protein
MALSNIHGHALAGLSHILGVLKTSLSSINGQTIAGGGGGGSAPVLVSSTRGSFSASPSTWDSPSVSGSNTLAVVMTYCSVLGGGVGVTGVTWNGVAMTEIAAANFDNGGQHLQAWYLIAPAAGVTSVVVTGAWDSDDMFADASCWTDANQTSPVDGGNTGSSAAAASVSYNALTSGDNEVVINQMLVTPMPTTMTADAPSTSLQAGSDGNVRWRCAYQTVASASSPAQAWTATGGTPAWRWNWISIKPV